MARNKNVSKPGNSQLNTPSKLHRIFVGALNCHGLAEKIDDPNIIDLIRQHDLFGTSETWLKDKTEIKVPGYKFYPLNRGKNKGPTKGGIGVFIKEDIKKHVKVRYDLSCETILWCKLEKKFFGFDDDLFIGFIYFPPESSSRERRLRIDHFKQLKESTTKIGCNNRILIGLTPLMTLSVKKNMMMI